MMLLPADVTMVDVGSVVGSGPGCVILNLTNFNKAKQFAVNFHHKNYFFVMFIVDYFVFQFLPMIS